MSAAHAASPLPEARLQLLDTAFEGVDAPGLWWISGYAAGLATTRAVLPQPAGAHEAPLPAAGRNAAPALTIVYGSQTGNARRVAERLHGEFESAGITARLLRADAYPLRELAEERRLLVVISTQGDGDPPDDALDFVEHLTGTRAPKLPKLAFGVFALGDSSYPRFCEIGRRLDARLQALGATRWLPLAEADLDVDAAATPWIAEVSRIAREAELAAPTDNVTPLRPHAMPAPVQPPASRERPAFAELLLNQPIVGRGGYRDVRHLELSLAGTGLDYEPGDALGVVVSNPPALVDAVLAQLRLDGDAEVAHDGRTLPLQRWLGEARELTRLSRGFVARHAELAGEAALSRLLEPAQQEALAHLLAQTQPIDLLLQHPVQWSAQDLVGALPPLVPRLYSIASSRKSVGDEAHLTVAHVEYDTPHGKRWGAASHHLATRAAGERLPVYVERNERFRLPADGTRDLIMIGPGTGVAPFRGFLQERVATGAGGRHWLFFGNPRARNDFLYQLEWQRALKQGQLHRLDLAFSRDTAHRTYVQHRLALQGREIYGWLRDGAHLYVCGSVAMGRDVHETLLGIAVAEGGFDADGAAAWLRDLQRQRRYARDVY